ncbi:MAG: hypothetical protein ACI8R9_002145 [Paraglaciecola sp.]|jgi:hypothetical protein
MKSTFLLIAFAGLFLSISSFANASIIVTNLVGNTTFTDPGANLLQGLTPTLNDPSKFGTNVNGNSDPLANVTNGVVGQSWADAGAGADSYFVKTGGIMTIALASAQSIDQINTYTSWNYDRIDQRYTLLTSSDGLDFTTLAIINEDHSDPDTAGQQLVELTNLGLRDVTHLRWDFSVPQPAGFAGYAEFAAFAVVSEPSTFALFGLGLAGLGWSRRKKAYTCHP